MTLTRKHVWVVLVSLVSLLQLVSSGGPVWCKAVCAQQPDQPCKVVTNKECPTDMKSSDWSPAPPSDLQVQTDLTKTSDDNLSLSFNVSWGVPSDSSLKYLKGFQLQIREIGGRWRQCLHFDLSSASWKHQDQLSKLRYHYDCVTNMEQTSMNFSIQVTSLPRPVAGVLYPGVNRLFTVIPVLPGSDGSSSFWSPEMISVYNDSCNSGVQVTFTQAPTNFHFTEYDAFLVRDLKAVQENTVKARGDIATVITVFTGLEPGKYHVEVAPKDTHRFSSDKCLCKRVKRRGQSECATCILTKSPLFTIHENHTACHVTSPSSSGKVVVIIIGVTFGVVFCIILAAAVVFYFKQRKVRRQGSRLVETMEHSVGLEANNNVEPLSEGTVPTRKRVLLLDVGGYKLHRYVVDCLAKYLVTRGHCDVQSAHSCVPDIRGDPVTWLSAEMNKSDKIVLVHSEGAHHAVQADLDPTHHRRPDVSPSTKLLLVAFHLLVKCRGAGDEGGWLAKLVVVRFPYTDELRHPLPVLGTERQYTLTDDMGSFLSSVHNKNVRLKCETDGQLETAIENMVAHVQKYPDWFHLSGELPVANTLNANQMVQLQRGAAGDSYTNVPRSFCCAVNSAPRREPTENESKYWIPPDSCSQDLSISSEQIRDNINQINSQDTFNHGPRLHSLSLPSYPESTTVPKEFELNTDSLDASEGDDICV